MTSRELSSVFSFGHVVISSPHDCDASLHKIWCKYLYPVLSYWHFSEMLKANQYYKWLRWLINDESIDDNYNSWMLHCFCVILVLQINFKWFWFEIICYSVILILIWNHFYNMILISISNHFENDFTQHWSWAITFWVKTRITINNPAITIVNSCWVYQSRA